MLGIKTWWLHISKSSLVFFFTIFLVGSAAGLFWHWIVILPTFEITAGLQARPVSEAAMASWFSIDSWFSIIGLFLGAGIGYWAWCLFRPRNWLLMVYTLGGSEFAAICCWQVGRLLGPNNFASRIAAAQVGNVVPVDFNLRAFSALLVWPLSAIFVIMIAAVLTREIAGKPDPTKSTMSE